MPYGHHIATCMHCGKQWTVGDCIPSICHECVAAGHDRFKSSLDCPACAHERAERTAEARRKAEQEERRRREHAERLDAMVLFDSHARKPRQP